MESLEISAGDFVTLKENIYIFTEVIALFRLPQI